MNLLITKENTFIELGEEIQLHKNDFGVWFWDNFFNIDGNVISNPILNNYRKIYTDFESEPKTKVLAQLKLF